MKRKTTEQFIEESNKIHDFKYDYSKTVYKNAKTKVLITCPIHGDFLQSPNLHIDKKCGCPKCYKKNYRITEDETKEKAKLLFNGRIEVIKYTKWSEPIICKCAKHGEFRTRAQHILNGKACRECRNELNAAKGEEFIEKARKVHGDRYDYSKVKYKNNKAKVLIICPIHGEFLQTPMNHLKYSCPFCRESKGERKIRVWLEEHNFKKNEDFFQQKCFESCRNKFCLPFDFYMPKENLLIEFQGRQHYEPVELFGGEKTFEKYKINDKIKREFAARNKYRLEEIRYDENVEEKLSLLLFSSVVKEAGACGSNACSV